MKLAFVFSLESVQDIHEKTLTVRARAFEIEDTPNGDWEHLAFRKKEKDFGVSRMISMVQVRSMQFPEHAGQHALEELAADLGRHLVARLAKPHQI